MSNNMVLMIILIFCTGVIVVIYNRLVSLRNRFQNAFSQIQVQLQRRYELIPNLVTTASSYMQHEHSTLLAVTHARNLASDSCSKAASNPGDAQLLGALATAEQKLSKAMGQFNLLVENYPELKADAQMRDLHEELTSTENRVAYARQAYSDAVMDFNISIEQFPAIIVARLFAFKNAELFEVEDEQMTRPVMVDFANPRST